MIIISRRDDRGAALLSIVEIIVVVGERNWEYGGHEICDYISQLKVYVSGRVSSLDLE